MKKLTECVKFELLQFRKNWWNYIMLAVFMIVTIYVSCKILKYNNHSPAYVLLSNSISIQLGTFVFLFFGFNLSRKEELYSCSDMFDAIKDCILHKYMAKFLIIIIKATAYCVASILLLFLIYRNIEAYLTLYVESFNFVVLYWLLTFLICGVLGLLIGVFCKSRFVYPILIFIGVLLGTYNVGFFRNLTTITQVDLWNLRNFLNLGISNLGPVFDPVYGFPLEPYRWLKQVFILVTLSLILYYAVYFKNNIKTRQTSILIFTLLIIPIESFMIYLFFQPRQVVNLNAAKQSVLRYDSTYYSTNQTSKIKSFDIISYDIDLKIKNKIQARVDIRFRPQRDIQNMTFTLYRDLIVSDVFLEEEEVDFIQKGDQILVVLNGKLKSSEDYNVSFRYKGFSAPRYFANEHAVNLPAYFPWIPVKSAYMPITNNDNSRSLTLTDDVEYVLRYEGTQPLFTNLENDGIDIWTGKKAGGVTLTSSKGMRTLLVDQTKVYIPASIYNVDENIKKVIHNIKESINKINSRLGLDYEIPSKVFLSSSLGNGFITKDNSIWYQHDHLIFIAPQIFNDPIYSKGFAEKNLEALVLRALSQNIQTYPNIDFVEMFLHGYNYYYNKNNENTFYYDLDKIISRTITQREQMASYNAKNVGDIEAEVIFYQQYKKFLDENIERDIGWFLKDFYIKIIQKEFSKTEDLIDYIEKVGVMGNE